VSRRARAIAFALAAAACAALAARSVSGYSAGVEAQLGSLETAVVARSALQAKRPIGSADLHDLEVRRVPSRFLPSGVLHAPSEALGRAPAATIPAGAYVLSAQLVAPGARRRTTGDASTLGQGRAPVEIAVTGAAPLAAARGGRVDVIVTAEPHGDSGEGRTYVAVTGVRLLDLRAADPGAGDGVSSSLPDSSVATLALTRAQALRLIQAQNFAREVRLVTSAQGR
jgi:Flp pilus assembly protein CpaB